MLRILSCLCCFVASAAAAFGCTPKVRAEVVRRATTLMPPALAQQLTRQERHLRAGALEGLPEAGGLPSALDPGDADAQLAAAVDEAARLLDAQASMAAVAHAFGRIARHATDLSYALHVGPHDPRAASIGGPFCRYVEEKLPKMRLTFGGYVDDDLASRDPRAFGRRVARDARRDYAGILRSYFPEGRRPGAQDFDDRSVAFGSASIETSLALTSVARAWLYAWSRAGGDVTGTPFLFDGGGSAAPRTPR